MNFQQNARKIKPITCGERSDAINKSYPAVRYSMKMREEKSSIRPITMMLIIFAINQTKLDGFRNTNEKQ